MVKCIKLSRFQSFRERLVKADEVTGLLERGTRLVRFSATLRPTNRLVLAPMERVVMEAEAMDELGVMD